MLKEDIAHGVVISIANGPNGKTMASITGETSEVKIGTGVDGNTIVLIIDVGVTNGDQVGTADVKGVSIVSAEFRAIGIGDGDVVQVDIGSSVDTEDLHW